MRKSLACLALLVTATFSFCAAPTQPIKIRWVLAHEPVGLFRRAAVNFAHEVESRSHGQIKVEVLTTPEYAAKYADNKTLHQYDVIDAVRTGAIEMSQTYTTSLGMLNSDMYVLDLPYLFRDHKHAQKVLEGKVGEKLLAGLNRAHVEGLAFTYSGGYRVIPAVKAIHTLEDFKGMKIRTSNSPVAKDTFSMIGAQPVPMSLEKVGEGIKDGAVVGAESTYARFYAMKQNEFSMVVNDTHHSLFLTSIIINQDFLQKLSRDQQKIVRAAAQTAARTERAESIADGEATKARCRKDGIQVVELPLSEEQKFKTATRSLYYKYATYFSPHLITDIEAN